MPTEIEVPSCACRKLPHDPDCPVAPFFDSGLTLSEDIADGDYRSEPAFRLQCPHCKGHFSQFEHAIGYNYEAVDAATESTEIPIVCPLCGYSDKQSLPAIVGFNPDLPEDDDVFTIQCPNCEHVCDRTDGAIDIWMNKEILMGVDEAKVGGITYKRGQTTSEYTELAVTCNECQYFCGEDE